MYYYEYRFNYTGKQQTLTIPPYPAEVVITAVGAQGGSTSTGTGGLGGYIRSQVNLFYSTTITLYITVGGSQEHSGYGGGGSSVSVPNVCPNVTYGGGATTIAFGSTKILIAGGGGSAGYDPNCTPGITCDSNSINGGQGGGSPSEQGSSSPMMTGSYGGYGGKGNTGGAGGYYDATTAKGYSGSIYQGGGAAPNTCGGGGGGGYGGGGGGANTGGGGGSTYFNPTYIGEIYMNEIGNNTGNGYVLISYWSTSMPPTMQPTMSPTVSYKPTMRPTVRPTLSPTRLPTKPSNPNSNDDDSSSNTNVNVTFVIVIAVGGSGTLCIALCVCYCCFCRNKRNKDTDNVDDMGQHRYSTYMDTKPPSMISRHSMPSAPPLLNPLLSPVGNEYGSATAPPVAMAYAIPTPESTVYSPPNKVY